MGLTFVSVTSEFLQTVHSGAAHDSFEALGRIGVRRDPDDVRCQLPASATAAPPLTESCKFTNTPDVLVPADRGVVGISAGRRGTEPALVSIAVRVGDNFRQDGTMYVPG